VSGAFTGTPVWASRVERHRTIEFDEWCRQNPAEPTPSRDRRIEPGRAKPSI
jgi:hypothetical protein